MGLRNLQMSFAALDKVQKILLLLIVLGIAIRICNVVSASAVEVDGIEYVSAARDLANGAIGKALASIRLPLFPATIALLHLFVPDLELAGRLSSLVFGILLVVFSFFFAERLWGSKTAFWVAGFVALHPYLAEYSARVLSESAATFFFTACVALFYSGWTSDDRGQLAWAGLFLTLAYLTKPEYVIYFLPLSFILLAKEKRFENLSAFLVCSLFVVFSFLVYLRIHTGFWVIDRKMLVWGPPGEADVFSFMSGAVSDPAVIMNVPFVLYHFGEAVFPIFFLLAILGFRKTDPRFRTLAIVLIVSHVIGRSFILHSTKRYSVEFVPIVLVFAANGVAVARDLFSRWRWGRAVFPALMVLSAGVLLFCGITFPNYGREMEKKAGLLLRREGEVSGVASRLPILGFYAGGAWTSLEKLLLETQTCDSLDRAMSAAKIDYLSVDDVIDRDHPFVRDCTPRYSLVVDLERPDKWLHVYKTKGR